MILAPADNKGNYRVTDEDGNYFIYNKDKKTVIEVNGKTE